MQTDLDCRAAGQLLYLHHSAQIPVDMFDIYVLQIANAMGAKEVANLQVDPSQ